MAKQNDADSPARVSFHATILGTGKTAAGIVVPPEAVEELGHGNGHPYASRSAHTRTPAQWR